MLGQDEFQAKLASELPTVETCWRFGMPLALTVLRVRQFPNWTQEQLVALRNLLLQADEKSAETVQYSLLLRDFETARRLMINTPVADPSFKTNMMKSILVGPQEGHRHLDRVTSHMLSVGFHDEAVNFSLLTDRWEVAIGDLLRLNRELEAALVCRAQNPGNVSKKKLAGQIAVQLCASGFIGYAVVLLAECDLLSTVLALFDDAGQEIQSDFLRFSGVG
jgi:hypothetical protein